MTRRPSGLIVPDLTLDPLGVSEAGLEHPLGVAVAELLDFNERVRRDRLIAGGASFSVATSKAILDHILNDGTFAAPTPYLALTTVVPDDTLTGVTITEAGYTGYARKALAAADFSAASGTTTATKTNTAAQTYAACTASSSTVIGWAVCDNSATSAGAVLMWGTTTSTVISTTQTPATVAIGGLVLNCD